MKKENVYGSFGSYILDRGGYLIISFLFVPILKVLVHYSMYAERYPLQVLETSGFRKRGYETRGYETRGYEPRGFNGEYKYENSTSSPDFSEIPGDRKPIEDHLELVFDVDGKLEIFIPLVIIYIFVWFLNYKLWKIQS
ncbi:MAG: hypothetical protein CMD02_03980 [Flavobacteriales bacterium]|nr:hypothetical protein [Flavobacteriales bacterium]|tara:strand:- start:138 stop:554 length:417 start_codon:yes stop_codon:yes gene_type:complete